VKKRKEKSRLCKPVGDSLGILTNAFTLTAWHVIALMRFYCDFMRFYFTYLFARETFDSFSLFPRILFSFSFRFNCKRFVAFWLEMIRSSQAQRLRWNTARFSHTSSRDLVDVNARVPQARQYFYIHKFCWGYATGNFCHERALQVIYRRWKS